MATRDVTNEAVNANKTALVALDRHLIIDSETEPDSLKEILHSALITQLLTDLAALSILPPGHLFGLTLSNNVADASNDIDIAAGKCRDSTDAVNMVLAAALTKRLDAAWAVGTGNGGLDTGAEANSTWYHVWLIKRSDTGVVDALFSTSATAPTMPTNYDYKRRLGAVKNNGSSVILPFLQYGDDFLLLTPILDVDVTNLGTTRTNYTLASVPTGFPLKASCNVAISNASSGTHVYISNPNLADVSPSQTVAPLSSIAEESGTIVPGIKMELWTDASAQISADSNRASTTLRVAVLGWEDRRGRLS